MQRRIYALVLDLHDNVATLLSDASAYETILLKGLEGTVVLSENIASGHKVALKPICSGGDILKYGQRIGTATKDINLGEWINLHNMGSAVDITFKKRIDSCTVKY